MTVAAHPALQPGFSSPPAARRSRKPMSSRGRQSSSDGRARARPAYTRDQTRLPWSIPPPRLRATSPRGDKREPSASLKSP